MKSKINLSEIKKNKTRKRIESTAKKIFFNKGYSSTTINEIAEKARIGKGSIYLHFNGKDDLFISLMIPTLNRLGEMLADFEKNLFMYKNTGEILRHYFEIHWELFKFDPDGIRIIQAYQNSTLFLKIPVESVEKFNKPAKRNYESSRRIIVTAQKMRLLPKVDSFQLVDIIWATALGIIQLEESKRKVNKKDNLFSTMGLAFSLISKGLEGLDGGEMF